jgi:RNA polymerase sigma-70 factor (ECF subfamily)
MEPTTRHSLVLRLRSLEDQAAWTEFVELYEPLIYRLLRKKGVQDADAHDLCQEVFRAVAGAIGRWDPNPAKGRFRAWLFRITRNFLINFLTAQRRQPRGSGSTSVQELLEAQQADDEQAAAEFALEFKRRAFRWAADQVRGEFAPTTWQAFWRTGVDLEPIAVVGRDLGMSVSAVYIARSRVLARLRERIEQWTQNETFTCEEPDHGPAYGTL